MVPGIGGRGGIDPGVGGRDGLAERDHAQAAEAGDDVGIVGGGTCRKVTSAGGGGESGDVVEVLDAEGDAVEGASRATGVAAGVGFGCKLSCLITIDEDPGTQGGVEAVDRGEASLEKRGDGEAAECEVGGERGESGGGIEDRPVAEGHRESGIDVARQGWFRRARMLGRGD